MKLTKYGHACLVLEEQGKKLIIDPGEFTPDLGDINTIIAVVVTHVHGDHLSNEHLARIFVANPNVKIFTTMEAAKVINDSRALAVKTGSEQTVGPFTLRFYGELHNVIHPEWPQNQNIAVLINDAVYYPGDSFTIPDRKVVTLAVPVGAPWLKMGEAIDFVKAVAPQQFFRTHDGLWNENGLATTDRWLAMASEKFGPKYNALNPGDSLEV
jgi:L-ascorbate metabolism protein UlaG (beta-lactamase superfamily)